MELLWRWFTVDNPADLEVAIDELVLVGVWVPHRREAARLRAVGAVEAALAEALVARRGGAVDVDAHAAAVVTAVGVHLALVAVGLLRRRRTVIVDHYHRRARPEPAPCGNKKDVKVKEGVTESKAVDVSMTRKVRGAARTDQGRCLDPVLTSSQQEGLERHVPVSSSPFVCRAEQAKRACAVRRIAAQAWGDRNIGAVCRSVTQLCYGPLCVREPARVRCRVVSVSAM
eukprot:6201264-Pleurochrysis_carterae.AAC.1